MFGCFRKFRAKRSNWEGGFVRFAPFLEPSFLVAMFIIGSSKGNGSGQLAQTTMLGSDLPMAIFSPECARLGRSEVERCDSAYAAV
jgi:hypothetical protein